MPVIIQTTREKVLSDFGNFQRLECESERKIITRYNKALPYSGITKKLPKSKIIIGKCWKGKHCEPCSRLSILFSVSNPRGKYANVTAYGLDEKQQQYVVVLHTETYSSYSSMANTVKLFTKSKQACFFSKTLSQPNTFFVKQRSDDNKPQQQQQINSPETTYYEPRNLEIVDTYSDDESCDYNDVEEPLTSEEETRIIDSFFV
jgi:hypothetical protein